MMSKTVGSIIVSALFILSIFVRLPFLNRPLGDRHEWILAHSLIPIENYSNYPVSKHLFRLVMTYPDTVNRYLMQTSTMRYMDEEGIGYYTTYPPFSAIFAHFTFKLLNLQPTILNLQLIGVFLHGISALVIFQICTILIGKRSTLAALAGTTVYLFSPSTLWFMSATYSWDIFWFYMLIFTLYLLIKITHDPAPPKYSFYLLTLLIGLTILSELQGIFLASGIILFTLLFNVTHKKALIQSTLVGTVIAISVFLLQKSFTQELVSFFKEMVFKVFKLYGTFGNDYLEANGEESWRRYQLMLTPSFYFSLIASLYAGLTAKKLKIITKSQAYLLSICLFPFVLHAGFMFKDIVIHEFAAILLTITLSFLIPFLISGSQQTGTYWPKLFQLGIICSTVVFIWISVKDFRTEFGPVQTQYQQLTRTIKMDLQPDEVLMFISPRPIPPIVDYYLKRNYALIKDISEARTILQKNGSTKAKIYELDEYRSIVNTTQIQNNL